MRRTLTVALLIAACAGPETGTGIQATAPAGATALASEEAPMHRAEQEKLEIRLEGAEGQAAGPAPLPRAEGRPLDDAAIAAVLARLPPLPAGGREAVALPKSSLPPPRTGQARPTPFPAQAASPPELVAEGPLALVRWAPEGAVELAPHLSVTFSQPMVSVGSHAQVAAEGRPVRLSPEPKGHWRWVGTRTLLFEPARVGAVERFPMATEFEVEVPAGTRSASGGVLAKTQRWGFRTPPPRRVSASPVSQVTSLQPVVVVVFDQAVDPEAVLATVRLHAGGQPQPIRLATGAEVEKDPQARTMVAQAAEGRALAFLPESPLPPASKIEVTVGPGTPSAEGPLTTAAAETFGFDTFAPLAVTDHRCGWGRECRPGAAFQLVFNNALDAERFDPALVRVSPELPERRVSVSGAVLTVQGATQALTTYSVTVDAALADVYGQSLGAPATLSFEVGEPQPRLQGSGGNTTVLDPGGPAVFPVQAIGLSAVSVEVYAVEPGQWEAYLAWRRGGKDPPPGRLALQQILKIETPTAFTTLPIDLYKVLGDAGHAVVRVRPEPRTEETRWQQIVTWVQRTSLGVGASASAEGLLVWATDLGDGRPLEGVTVRGKDQSETTGRDGLARLRGGPEHVVARKGGDSAILEVHPVRPGVPRLAWYVVDDRRMYRPGETARFKGWVRRIEPGPSGDVVPAGLEQLTWRAVEPRRNELARGQVTVDAFGGFDLELPIPEEANLGTAWLHLESSLPDVGGASMQHAFQIQAFRRPEYEVGVTLSEGPHVQGRDALATVEAAYYAGGPLGGAPVAWSVSARPTTYRPPGHDGFSFGPFVPWWTWRGRPTGQGAGTFERFEAKTGADGRHVLRLAFPSGPPSAQALTVEATVTDVNRQAWTARREVVLHPARHYVGLRAPRPFLPKVGRFEVEALVVDLDGAVVTGRPVAVTAERMAWEQVKGEWKERVAERLTCALESKAAPATCTFEPKQGGRWQVRARVQDPEGRPSETVTAIWVAGEARPPLARVEREEVRLIPEKASFEPGETARVLLVAPFYPAEALVRVGRDGLADVRRVQVEGPSQTLEIPLKAEWVPGVHLVVDLVGSAPRTDPGGSRDLPPRPAFASGSLALPISTAERRLEISVDPSPARLAPGEESALSLRILDHAGRPVAAQALVMVVDEAVLAVSGYQLADPVDLFHPRRGPGFTHQDLRAHLVLAQPEAPGEEAPAGDKEKALRAPSRARAMETDALAGAGPAEPAIALRTDFDPLAHFSPVVRTGKDGRAVVKVRVPDNLTRYRIMVVATDGEKRFGTAESALTARLPLMVRPSAPRFLNYGDRFELPVVLQNQTDAPLTVRVAARASGLELTAARGLEIEVPADDRVEVRLPALSGPPGKARVQVAATSGPYADAALVELPVWTPATTEAFATYGTLTKGALAQPVAAPADAFPQVGGLTVSTSSTELQSLTDAVIYLVDYPYGCTEQIASRVLAVAALRDVLSAFSAEGLPAPEVLLPAVQADVEALVSRQDGEGGFGLWRKGEHVWPFTTLHAIHALILAERKGFEVPEDALRRSRRWLSMAERHAQSIKNDAARRTVRAYALYLQSELGEDRSLVAERLVKEAGGVKGMPLEALAWVLPQLSKTREQALRRIVNAVAETAATAQITTGYGDDGWLIYHSPRRTDGVVLGALLRADPRSDLIPKLVRGLLAHRERGRWGNTQENAWVLIALDRYFGIYEGVTPDFVARVWLGGQQVGEHAFEGRSTERGALEVPMASLQERPQPVDLILSHQGEGRLYYRLGLRYAPKDLRPEPADHGFTVERTYEAADDPGDLRRDPDGAWHVRAGARIKVKLTLVASARRYHVALEDRIPAGFEPLNPALAVTGALPPATAQKGGGRHWWHWQWYQHENLRDERAEAFTALLHPGVYEYAYYVRATTPGVFVAPPARAEEMYFPETFGRGAGDRVVIE